MIEPIELHLNADRNITPEKREILVKMFGLLAVKAMEEAPNVLKERRLKESLKPTKQP